MSQCVFDIAWVGRCKNSALPELDILADKINVCAEHSKIKCKVCGEQAVRECEDTFALVCGVPLCRKCKCPNRDEYGDMI